MQKSTDIQIDWRQSDLDDNNAPSPRIVVLYSNAASGRRAMHNLESVFKNVDPNLQLSPRLWRFDLLDSSYWRKIALDDAAAAEIVVISPGTTDEQETLVVNSIKAYLREQVMAPNSFVLVLAPACQRDSGQGSTNTGRNRSRNIASSICEPSEQRPVLRLGGIPVPTLNDLSSYHHGGLNE